MKKYLLLITTILFMQFAQASIQISEVYYDPVTTESGGEAIELYNSGSETVDISGWVIKTESSARDAVLPDGSTILPEGIRFSQRRILYTHKISFFELFVHSSSISGGILLC